MAKILAKGESVYECDVCKRRVRVPTSRTGIDVVQRCIVTSNCRGKLHKLILTKDINATPAFPPEVAGVQDWFQRKVLHTHEQPVQSAKWVINHDLANKPNLYVYVQRYIDGKNVNVETTAYTVKIVDLNTLELTFSQAEQGLAQCITSASQNSTNPSATAGVAVASDDMAITVNGEMTIATLDTADSIVFALTYNSPSSSSPVIIEYIGVNNPTTASPWSGLQYVVVNGKRYRVRSFNITTTQLAPPYFAAGAVASGSTITVTHKPAVGEMLILLANAPYSSVDRIHGQYIDIATLAPTPRLYYQSGVVYAPPAVIKNTYPPIIVA